MGEMNGVEVEHVKPPLPKELGEEMVSLLAWCCGTSLKRITISGATGVNDKVVICRSALSEFMASQASDLVMPRSAKRQTPAYMGELMTQFACECEVAAFNAETFAAKVAEVTATVWAIMPTSAEMEAYLDKYDKWLVECGVVEGDALKRDYPAGDRLLAIKSGPKEVQAPAPAVAQEVPEPQLAAAIAAADNAVTTALESAGDVCVPSALPNPPVSSGGGYSSSSDGISPLGWCGIAAVAAVAVYAGVTWYGDDGCDDVDITDLECL